MSRGSDETAPPDPGEVAFNQARGVSGGGPDLPAIDFTMLVLSFAHSARMHLGDAPDPSSGAREVSLPLARQSIDLIQLLQEKTRGNLTGDEERVLEHTLFDLRMRYVEVVKSQ